MVTPCKRQKMQSFRNMSKAVKNLTEMFHMENLPVGKLPGLFGGEHSGFDSRDCWNHMEKFRHKELESGDAQSVLQYFRKKVEENPQFYYAIQCDDDVAASCGYGVASSQGQPDDGIQLDAYELNPSQFSILDPKLSQTKGRKKVEKGKEVVATSSRIKSGIEMVRKGRKRLCRSCQKFVNRASRNCPLNQNSKRSKQLTISEDDEEEEEMDDDDDD